MSRSAVTYGYAFWRERPDVTWNSVGEPQMWFDPGSADIKLCEMANIHKLFPSLEIPPGELAEVEVIEMEHGYYIGFVE